MFEINIENIKKLITRLQKENKVSFNMRSFFEIRGETVYYFSEVCHIVDENFCGTNACIAGHASILAYEDGSVKPNDKRSISDIGETWLGLDLETASFLFYGEWGSLQDNNRGLSGLTKEEAITELERLISLKEQQDHDQ